MRTAHSEAIRRMIDAAPPFRPRADAAELVRTFAEPSTRMPAFLAPNPRAAPA